MGVFYRGPIFMGSRGDPFFSYNLGKGGDPFFDLRGISGGTHFSEKRVGGLLRIERVLEGIRGF